jgi:hypothetical protein
MDNPERLSIQNGRWCFGLSVRWRLLASDLLPRRAGAPVKALLHIYFAELSHMDAGGVLQDQWITEYRARRAGHCAAAVVPPGDGGAWLDADVRGSGAQLAAGVVSR